jgi:hypothetical protein
MPVRLSRTVEEGSEYGEGSVSRRYVAVLSVSPGGSNIFKIGICAVYVYGANVERQQGGGRDLRIGKITKRLEGDGGLGDLILYDSRPAQQACSTGLGDDQEAGRWARWNGMATTREFGCSGA